MKIDQYVNNFDATLFSDIIDFNVNEFYELSVLIRGNIQPILLDLRDIITIEGDMQTIFI